MTFFTSDEFEEKYGIEIPDIDNWKIEAVSEMIYSQIGLTRRGAWDNSSVPDPVKQASMEQLRFMYEYDIPLIDYKGKVEAGAMKSELSTDYSTLALRILANNGYLYRGNPSNQNMSYNMTWSD
jgi:hypothetical protein